MGLLHAGVGWLGGASASKAVARDSLVSGAKAGCLRGAEVAEAGHVKEKEPKVARLQASQLAGLIHCPWLGCLYVSISWFRLVPYPSRRW